MMRTGTTLLAAAFLTGALASPAMAAKPEPVPPSPAFVGPGCGGTLTITEVRIGAKMKEVVDEVTGEFSAKFFGNVVLSASLDGGEPVLLRLPGSFQVQGSANSVSFSSQGRTLLIPATPVTLAAQRAAGLPDFAILSGRFRATETLNPDTGETTAARVDQVSGNVTDLCDLLT
jgi:hypothetical protein